LQEFGFSEKGEIQFEEDLCLDTSTGQVGGRINIYSCHGFGGNQKWIYNSTVSRYVLAPYRPMDALRERRIPGLGKKTTAGIPGP
jgi:hypothetical protein